MKRYDPEKSPAPTQWLALDEFLRMSLVEAYHRSARTKLPDAKLHAIIHVVVENQLSEDLKPVVLALARLMKEGLSRHEAVHAIGCVVAEYLFEAMKTEDENFRSTAHSDYYAAVERLTSKSWKSKYGS